MKINVLNLDGLNCATDAWRLSREVDVPVEWRDVYTVDCPVNEMPSALLHFHEFTILEREIFSSSRTHVMWARTSFVDKPDRYQLPKDLVKYSVPQIHHDIREKMAAAKAAGLHQDEWRQDLPLVAETSFVMRVSYRDVLKFAKYFLYLCDNLDVTVCLTARFQRVSDELLAVADRFTGDRASTLKALNGMGLVRYLHEDSVTPRPMVETAGFYSMTFEVPLWLRAHFVRHRPLPFIDDMFQILRRDDVTDLTIRHPVVMEVGVSKDFWKTIVSKRSCWLTQSTLKNQKDPWNEIVEAFADAAPDMLPCSGGACPHHKDARLRIEGRDPGSPCPMYLKLNKIDPAPFQDQIEQALPSRPAFWKTVYEEARG